MITKKDFQDKNIIKIIKNNLNEAISFSRQSIPYMKNFKKNIALRQVCIISFTREGLLGYSKMRETKMKYMSQLTCLDFLDNGFKIKLTFISDKTYPVDTITDLKKLII